MSQVHLKIFLFTLKYRLQATTAAQFHGYIKQRKTKFHWSDVVSLKLNCKDCVFTVKAHNPSNKYTEILSISCLLNQCTKDLVQVKVQVSLQIGHIKQVEQQNIKKAGEYRQKVNNP